MARNRDPRERTRRSRAAKRAAKQRKINRLAERLKRRPGVDNPFALARAIVEGKRRQDDR